jgi:hypothetical protein
MLAVPGGALAVLLGFALHAEVRYRRRAAAIRELQEVGRVVFGDPPPPSWFSKLLGRRAKADLPVHVVMLEGEHATERALADIGLITELEYLNLGESAVNDAGLAHIGSLANLKQLELSRTSVTDAGLAHLPGLPNIEWLGLIGTGVTDAGLAHLRDRASLECLYLDHTGVTDAGLSHLHGLANLRWLGLSGTRVTDAGMAEFRKHLPNTSIRDR